MLLVHMSSNAFDLALEIGIRIFGKILSLIGNANPISSKIDLLPNVVQAV